VARTQRNVVRVGPRMVAKKRREIHAVTLASEADRIWHTLRDLTHTLCDTACGSRTTLRAAETILVPSSTPRPEETFVPVIGLLLYQQLVCASMVELAELARQAEVWI
jgi:hypothetical protein